jgi:hypothetical protein
VGVVREPPLHPIRAGPNRSTPPGSVKWGRDASRGRRAQKPCPCPRLLKVNPSGFRRQRARRQSEHYEEPPSRCPYSSSHPLCGGCLTYCSTSNTPNCTLGVRALPGVSTVDCALAAGLATILQSAEGDRSYLTARGMSTSVGERQESLIREATKCSSQMSNNFPVDSPLLRRA